MTQSGKTLKDRCREILTTIHMDGMLRQHDPVETLLAFVLAEKGRVEELERTMPLVMYFANDEDRQEMIDAVRAAKPGMISRKLP